MYYVRNTQTGKVVYMSRFGTRARQFYNKIRGGMSYYVDSDKATPQQINELATEINNRRSR
jgi:hypothetical protein